MMVRWLILDTAVNLSHFLSLDVTLNMIPLLSVGEGDGMVQVCATLSAIEDTERNITITLYTSDGTGIEVKMVGNSHHCLHYSCSWS